MTTIHGNYSHTTYSGPTTGYDHDDDDDDDEDDELDNGTTNVIFDTAGRQRLRDVAEGSDDNTIRNDDMEDDNVIGPRLPGRTVPVTIITDTLDSQSDPGVGVGVRACPGGRCR